MHAPRHKPMVGWSWIGLAFIALTAAGWPGAARGQSQSSSWPQSSSFPQQAAPQVQTIDVPSSPWVIVPQAGAYAPPAPVRYSKAGPAPGRALRIASAAADISADEEIVRTTVSVVVENPGSQPVTAVVLLPLPPGATPLDDRTELLTDQAAWQGLTGLIQRTRDPTLLALFGLGLARSAPIPVPAQGHRRIGVSYSQRLTPSGERLDVRLPRPEVLGEHARWRITARLRSKLPIAAVYSPSHPITARRAGPGDVTVDVPSDADTPGPFRLSWQRTRSDLAISLFASPALDGAGGFFMLVADGHDSGKARASAIRREVTLVIDRSGSMTGQKLEQVRAAAKRLIAGLSAGEAFNLIAYNETVDTFAPSPVSKTPASQARAERWLDGMRSRGGTDLYSALRTALDAPPTRGSLPIVLFLTDGLPTVGQTSERAIRKMASEANRARRRIFTFGVGVDVNTPLLEALASRSRAFATFVLPGQDVGRKVDRVFAALSGPVLADPVLVAASAPASKGKARGPVTDLLPTRLPDLFEGDQLVVLGRYRGRRPIKLELAGNFRGRRRTFLARLEPARAGRGFAYVARLWASRKIASLVEKIRASGADADRLAFQPSAAQAKSPSSLPSVFQAQKASPPPADPRFDAWVAEAVGLSRHYGVLTEYTAFLAGDLVDLGRPDQVVARASGNFQRRAVRTRSGLSSVNQDYNKQKQAQQVMLNPTNTFFDARMNPVSTTRVQQVADLAFFLRGRTWIDSRLLAGRARLVPAEELRFGTPAFWKLVRELVREQRQAALALHGQVLIEVDGQPVLVHSVR